jgi:glycosyltransferase 2 family protein
MGGLPGDSEPPLVTEDHVERRVRKPADLLRLVLNGAGLLLLAGAGLAAQATATGADEDIASATRRLPSGLLSMAGVAAGLALLVLPAGLAVAQLVHRQPRRLVQAVVTAVVTAVLVGAASALLRLPAAAHMHAALTVSRHGAATAPLDAYLAAFAAYVTVIDLSARPRWRTGVWLVVLAYVIASVTATQATILSVAITLLLGRTAGIAARYAAGLPSQRPPATEIAGALSQAGLPVGTIRRTADQWGTSRSYAVSLRTGGRLDVAVFDRDQEAAGALYRFYRLVRLRGQVSRGVPLSLEHAVERRALLSYATADAQIVTPRLRAALRVGPDTAVLAYDHQPGITLAERAHEPSDAELSRIWAAVVRLHAHGVAHRALTADRILIADGTGGPGDGGQVADGEVVLLDPSNGNVAASDLQLRLDNAQLLAELAVLAGPDRAIGSALANMPPERLAGVVPLLQPVALYRTTRTALRQHRDLLPGLRTRLLAASPDGEVPPVRLERVRLRTLVSLVGGAAAVYVLAGQLARVNLAQLIRHADWRWTMVALALSALTYLAAALSLTGFVLERLSMLRTALAQLAASFVTLVAPAAVGGAALNIRYLQRNGVPPASATASVGVTQAIAFVLHMLLLIAFAAITGAGQVHSLQPPIWVYFALAGLLALLLAALAIPPSRRLLRARVVPTLEQVLPRLLDVAQNPRKLAEGLGGALLLTATYVLCLAASIRAVGGSVPLTSVTLVYLTGSALGATAPTPGGLGAVEVALSAGLTAAGLPSATAVSSVLLFRLLTFWLPVPFGWISFAYLQRRALL